MLSIVRKAFAIPIKLRYDCPPASKFGSDAPLWKTATTGFLAIVENVAACITEFAQGMMLPLPCCCAQKSTLKYIPSLQNYPMSELKVYGEGQ